ncbi:MAG: hypothetical protein WB812_06360 [Woeseiaceae bacterium]
MHRWTYQPLLSLALLLQLSAVADNTAAASSPAAERTPKTPIRYDGEISVNTNADGGLRPVLGVHNIEVVRANRHIATR